MPSPDEMLAAVVDSMKQRTGRDLDEWVALVEASGIDPLDQRAVRGWLKDTHGVPQNTQWAIAFEVARRAGWVQPDVEGYADQQYTGAKASLRPIFDRVRTMLEDLGDDVTLEGRGGYIPFVRRRQFAAVAAATRTRVDLGLRFVDPPTSSLLTPSNGPGQSTHKVGLTSPDEVTDAVADLSRAAYEQNG
jgi:predicted transport protein